MDTNDNNVPPSIARSRFVRPRVVRSRFVRPRVMRPHVVHPYFVRPRHTITNNNDENRGPNGQSTTQERTERHIENLHTMYRAILMYNNRWYGEQLYDHSQWLDRERADIVQGVMNRILDELEQN